MCYVTVILLSGKLQLTGTLHTTCVHWELIIIINSIAIMNIINL